MKAWQIALVFGFALAIAVGMFYFANKGANSKKDGLDMLIEDAEIEAKKEAKKRSAEAQAAYDSGRSDQKNETEDRIHKGALTAGMSEIGRALGIKW